MDDISLISIYKESIDKSVLNPVPFVQLGTIFKRNENWDDVIATYKKATELFPKYSLAWRELGIAENKLYHRLDKPTSLNLGKKSLLKAIELNPKDYDSFASLGGIYKREGMFQRSIEMYDRSVQISKGNSYPLLNYLILQIRGGITSISLQQKLYIKKIELQLRKQIPAIPPSNAPWTFFDLSTICLLTGRKEKAFAILLDGLRYAKKWEVQTHLETLLLMKGPRQKFPGLDNFINLLNKPVC